MKKQLINIDIMTCIPCKVTRQLSFSSIWSNWRSTRKSKDLKQQLLIQQNNLCAVCMWPLEATTFDHIIPMSVLRDEKLIIEPSNLQLVHMKCNIQRHHRFFRKKKNDQNEEERRSFLNRMDESEHNLQDPYCQFAHDRALLEAVNI